LKQISANPTNWAFFHPDQVGSVSLITNGQGLLIAQISHRPFGGIDQAHSVGSPEALKNWASYTGQEMDPETGLIYYQFRYYDPSLRRFLSPDNSTPKGPSVSQTYNRYAYVQNNPINFNDPTGHKGCHWYDLYCRGKVAVNDTIDTVKKVGNNAAEAVKTNLAYAKNTPLVRSIDNRRAEATHILGLDNVGVSVSLGQSGEGGNCFTKNNCFDSFSDPIGSADRDYKSFRQWGQNHLKQKETWYVIGAVVTAGCAMTPAVGFVGLSGCAFIGGFVGGYGYSRANGNSRKDSFVRGTTWGGNATSVVLAIQIGYWAIPEKGVSSQAYFGTSDAVNKLLGFTNKDLVLAGLAFLAFTPKEETMPRIYDSFYLDEWNLDWSDNTDVWYWN